ncbi:MAG: hypothetical protein Q9218_005686 [Villophora microphyllina]
MSAQPPPAPRPYVSGGQVLQTPPLSARIRNFIDGSYNFLGLYVTTLFSFDAYAAAEQSPFNIRNRHVRRTGGASFWRTGSGGGGGGGGSGGSSGGADGGRKIGRVDDVRGPECKSCG